MGAIYKCPARCPECREAFLVTVEHLPTPSCPSVPYDDGWCPRHGKFFGALLYQAEEPTAVQPTFL
jgi:hypothetical protein